MAIVFIADIEGVSSDLTTAYVQDLTVTYGGANPSRNELALYLALFKRDAEENDVAITVLNNEPLTASQWPFALPSPDGVFVGLMLGFSIWQAGVYANQACVYYLVDGNYYIANVSTSGVPGSSVDWTLITDIISTGTGNSSVEQTQIYLWSSARSSSGQLADAMMDLGQKIRLGRCKSLDEAVSVLTGASLIDSAFTNFRAGSYSLAQQIIDYVQQQTSLTI